MLADLADRAGYCFPSHQYVAYVAEISKSTVRRRINELLIRKLVAIERRFNQHGGRTSNGYRLALDNRPSKLKGCLFNAEPAACPTVSTPLSMREHATTTEPSFYPKPPPPPTFADRAATRRKALPTRTGRSELHFPKGIPDALRNALERHVCELTRVDAQQVLDELTGAMNSRTVRNPIRYCAALIERLKRGDFHLELGIEVEARRAADLQRAAALRNTSSATNKTPHPALKPLPEDLRAPMERMRARSAALPARDTFTEDPAAHTPPPERSD